MLIACAAFAVGAVNMATNMDASVVERDVMLGWALAAAVQWILVEPLALGLFAGCGLFLKWCTDFDDVEHEAEAALQIAAATRKAHEEAPAAQPAAAPQPALKALLQLKTNPDLLRGDAPPPAKGA